MVPSNYTNLIIIIYIVYRQYFRRNVFFIKNMTDSMTVFWKVIYIIMLFKHNTVNYMMYSKTITYFSKQLALDLIVLKRENSAFIFRLRMICQNFVESTTIRWE